MSAAPPVPSRSQERASAGIHAGGGALAMVGGGVLASTAQGSEQLLAAAALALPAVGLFAASALHHGASWAAPKRLFLALDHAGVLLLIAGSYTAFALVGLQGPARVWLTGLVWSITIAALAFEAAAFLTGREAWFERAAPILCLALGWGPLLLYGRALGALLPASSAALLLAGGVAYSLGVGFFLSPRRWAHAAWHVAVVIGCALHFAAIFAALGPATAAP